MAVPRMRAGEPLVEGHVRSLRPAGMKLGLITDANDKEVDARHRRGVWNFDEDDLLLGAMLADPIYGPELMWDDPGNQPYSGCYRVRDYQWSLFRPPLLENSNEHFRIYACARSVGKALADDEPVLTPNGWVPIGRLRVGDLVLGAAGAPTVVIGVYPQGPRRAWQVTFTDGTAVTCDEEHLWTVTCDAWRSHHKRGRMSQPVKTRRTGELAQAAGRFKTPLPGVSHFAPRADPELDPWLVGALLGDGNLTRPTMIRFASVDGHNIERLRAALPPDAELVHDGGCNYRIRSREYVLARPGDRSPGRAPHRLLAWARESGFHGKAAHEKRVPHEYLWGSPTVRLELLRGLVDTDGSITHAGSVEFSSASRQLAEDVAFLARSLGGRASIRTGSTPGRDRHRVVFRIERLVPCSLPRKVTAYAVPRQRDTAWRGIRSIRPLEDEVPMTCIAVAAEDGLFITRDFVVTHNTESIKAKAFTHPFRRHGQNLLITAPELIHLLPLTDSVEDRIRDTRLTREFLDTRGGQTGFTHRPFGVNFRDGTKIVGRIPRLTGTGVKGQHQPDLIVDEGQDYPEKGWIEVNETVSKDILDADGNASYNFEVYGVHSGARDSGFFKRATQGGFSTVQITALQRPSWSAAEKEAAKAAYGGTSSPDYRRNILGEPGAAASAFFVISRLMACLDQDRESDYNQIGYRHQELRAEEFEDLGLPLADVLDLPQLPGRKWAGADLGLTNSPTVISIFNEAPVKDKGERSARPRLTLVRRITMERFRARHIVDAWLAIGHAYGSELDGFGVDATGLGFPIVQAMEDDQGAPPRLLEITRGYFFNSKVPVGVDESFITEDSQGNLRDQYGSAVKLETDPLTGVERFVTYMPMIEASTRYLRDFVDATFLRLPFDTDITQDMLGETQQRVRNVGGLQKKPNAFHILDSFRGMAMAYRAGEVEAALTPAASPVLERAL